MQYQFVEITPRIRAAVKKAASAAIAYEKLTGRKLGITGEIAEVLVCDALGLKLLSDPLSAGFDALGKSGKRYQIKSRRAENNNGRMGRFSLHDFDFAILALLNPDYSLRSIYKAPSKKLAHILASQKRRQPSVRKFKSIAKKVIFSPSSL